MAWNFITLTLWWQDLEHKLTFAQQAGKSGERVGGCFVHQCFFFLGGDMPLKRFELLLRHFFLIYQVVLRTAESKKLAYTHCICYIYIYTYTYIIYIYIYYIYIYYIYVHCVTSFPFRFQFTNIGHILNLCEAPTSSPRRSPSC